MKITYAQNPLNTTIELDEAERKALLAKITIEQLKEEIGHAAFLLGNKEHAGTPADVLKATDSLVRCDASFYSAAGEEEGNPFDQRCEEILNNGIADLKLPHCGDCTCVPCSCFKCYMEELLGISTLNGLGKHEGHKLSTFKADATADEIIAELAAYDPYKKCSWGTPDKALADRWKSEAHNAMNWMIKYKAEHNF